MPSSTARPISRRNVLRQGLGALAVAAAAPSAFAARRAAAHGRLVGPQALRVGAGAGAAPADVAAAWFDLSMRLVRDTPGFSPPVASRAFAYLGVTLYEAVVPGMPAHGSITRHVDGLDEVPLAVPAADHDWAVVANSSLAAIVRNLFASASDEDQAAVDRLEARLGGSQPHRRSAARGAEVAAAVFAWSRSDGGHEGERHNFPDSYQPPRGPGRWVSTPPDHLPALQPYWGANRPFVVDSTEAFGAQPHTPFSTDPGSAFWAEAREVYEAVNDLTDEQRAIAEFWSDDPGTTATPPGHSIALATQVLREMDASLETAAETYLRLGMAVADAFICCWHDKYETNLLRPVTYINAHIDPDWESPLVTPPFPEYPSGHSVQSAAAAEVLTAMFGDHTFTDRTHDARGLAPRRFESFSAAADEAAISRLYGGIHYRPAIEFGLTQGRKIGDAVAGLDLHA